MTQPPAALAGAARYCFGSRRRDLATCALLATLVLAGGPYLAVYHRVTVMALSAVRIEVDGRRSALPVPPSLLSPTRHVRVALSSPARALRVVERRIQQAMRDDPAIAAAPPGTRFEWTVRYSENSTRLDREATYVRGVPASGSR